MTAFANSTLAQPAGYSIQDHWITLDGGRMRYLRDGTGPPLVLVHGLLGYSFSWRYAIPAFAQHSTVYAVDMLGVGFSDRPEGLDSSLRANAERLLGFLDAAGIASCDLLGTSHGGAVCMMAAAIDPGRIRRLVLVAPVNPWSHNGKRLASFLSHPLVAPLFLTAAPHLEFIHLYLLSRLYADPSRIRPGTLEGYSAPFSRPGTFRYELGILKSWHRDLEELEAAMPRLSAIPTLLLWGACDNAVVPESAIHLRKQFKQSDLQVFEKIGHLPYEEAPDEFNLAVSSFLTK